MHNHEFDGQRCLPGLHMAGYVIIGDVKSRKISSVLMQAGESLEREVNFSVFLKSEFVNRLKTNDQFISRVVESSMMFLIGKASEFIDMADIQTA